MKNLLILVTSIFKSHSKKYLLSDQKGAVLVAFIFGMVIVAGVGAGLISINTTTSFNQFGSNDSMKAYYLAESGRRYVLQQANAGVDITTIPTTPFTLANGDDQFVITNTTYGNLLNLSFRSSSSTTAGVKREINYTRSTDPGENLSNNPGQGLSEPGGDDDDEAFDNDCDDSHGYRSNNSGAAIVGVAYIGYDMSNPPGPPPSQKQILFLEYAGPEDGGDNAIASAKFQGSNDINFGVGNIGADVTLTLNTDDNPRGPCSSSFFQGFILPTTFGAFQYWRLLANAPASDGWEVQELRMYGGAGGVVETQT